MFDFFGLKKTRAKLVELEFVLEKQKSDIKTLEKVIDRLRVALENEVSKNLQTESKSPKKKAVLETQPAQIVAAPAYEPIRSSTAPPTGNSSNDMMTGYLIGSLLSDNHNHSHSSSVVSSDTYSSSSSSSDSGSSSSSSD
jgi:hypothetical protein